MGLVVVVLGFGGVALAVGIWAFLLPDSFYRVVAPFPPYNEHFIHDAGVGSMGLGVALLVSPRWRDSATVALAGFTTTAIVHAVGHVLDSDLGGRWWDPWALGLLAVAAAFALWRSRKRQT